MSKHDRRSQRTRQLVGEAFVQLLKEKGYSAITVSDIIERANIGRSTFYSHYRDKDDLFVAQLDRVIEALSRHAPDQGEIPFFPSLGLFRHVGEEYELYKAIVWTPGIDLFVKHLQTSLSHRIEQGLKKSGNDFDIPHPILANFIAGSFLTLLKWWLENKMIYSPEEMDAMFKKLTVAGLETMNKKT
ncbi:MAG TPA: TetR/AcrR family transcriptional regulator [Anaerolineales bacterium]|nr:TetR/AcrR family transcriptional regulator [Anaerolineales bacterium]